MIFGRKTPRRRFEGCKPRQCVPCVTVMKTLPLVLPALFSLTAFAAEPAKPVAAKAAGESAKPARRTLVQLAEDKRVVATELVQLMRLDKQVEASIAEVHAGLDAQINQGLNGPAAAHRALIEEYRKKLHAAITEGMDWNLMKPEVVKAYTDQFSEEELKSLVEFFKSPVGRSFAEKSDKVMSAISQATRKRMQEVQPRIQSGFYELNLRLQQAMQQSQQGGPSAPAGAQGGNAAPVSPTAGDAPDGMMPVAR